MHRLIAPQLPWKALWKLKIPPKLQFFTLRTLWNILPTQAKLHNIHMPTCTLHHNQEESADCLFFFLFCHCSVTKSIWFSFPSSAAKPTDYVFFPLVLAYPFSLPSSARDHSLLVSQEYEKWARLHLSSNTARNSKAHAIYSSNTRSHISSYISSIGISPSRAL